MIYALVPKDLDVQMKAVGLAALFLIVSVLISFSFLSSIFCIYKNMMHFSPRDNRQQNVYYV